MAGRPIPIRITAASTATRRVEIYGRRFGRDQTVYDPWHYLPVLARKPGALRNGEPFRDCTATE